MPGPTGALTLPPCVTNELVWMNPEHVRTEAMRKAWEPEVWQKISVDYDNALRLAEEALQEAKTCEDR